MKKWMQGSIALLLATQVWAAPFPMESTEERNASVGFAVTSWMAVEDALGRHCASLEGVAGSRSRESLARWDERNGPLVSAAFQYLVIMGALAARTEGAEAEAAFHAARQAEFKPQARATQLTWFPDGMFDEQGCIRLAAAVQRGVYDIAHHDEMYRNLAAIQADLERLRDDPRLSDLIPPEG